MTETNSNDLYNADELEAPKWLNAEFITEVLSKHEKEPNLKVLDLKITPASGKGDHYASVMFRASVEYETKKGKFSKSLIVKTMPEQEGHKKDLLEQSNVFETEIGMYSEVLPKFEKILQGVGDNTKLYVPCIYHSLQPRRVLIFDDLVPMGYIVMRNREPTIEELQCSLSKLAKWHAVSMKVLNEEPEYLKGYKHGLAEMKHFLDDPMVTSGMDNLLEMINNQPTLSKYKPFLEKIKVNYLDELRVVMSEYRNNRREDTYYVLSHGDFHLRNMLFKHNKDTGILEDCMLVDFQLCNLCPITVDTVYSIYMLISPEQRSNDWESLLNYYFSVLLETLKKIGYKGALPTSNGFWSQIHRAKYYAFFLICTFLPMMWAMKSNQVDFGELAVKNDVRQKCFQIQGYVEDVTMLFSRFENLGYFNNL